MLGKHSIKGRITQDLFAPPPAAPLPQAIDLRQIGMEGGEQTAACTLLSSWIGEGWGFAGKEGEQAPRVTCQRDRLPEGRGDGPSERGNTRQEAEFVLNVAEKLCLGIFVLRPAPKHKPLTTGINQPMLIEPPT
jgi:hypothetical protein